MMKSEQIQSQEHPIGAPLVPEHGERVVDMHEFLRYTFPTMPCHGVVSINTMHDILYGLHRFCAPPTDHLSNQQDGPSLWIRGDAVWSAIYGPDPYRDTPRSYVERYAKDDSGVKLPHHVIRSMTRYFPDIDIYAGLPNGVRAYDIQISIMNAVGLAPSQYHYHGGTRRISFVDSHNPRRLIKVEIDDHFGDPEGEQKRMKIKIEFFDNTRCAMDIAQDMESYNETTDEAGQGNSMADMRLNHRRSVLDVLGTFPIHKKGKDMEVTMHRALDATLSLPSSFNPFSPVSSDRRGYSQAFSSLIRAAAKASGKPFEKKFLSEIAMQNTNPSSEHLFKVLLRDATAGDYAMCSSLMLPSEDDKERKIFEMRALPLAQIDIVYGLIRNPYRFLPLLLKMKRLASYLPISNPQYAEVVNAMMRCLEKYTGCKVNTLVEASMVYEEKVLGGSARLPSGLEMLAEITGVRDVLSLFTPHFSRDQSLQNGATIYP